MSLQITPLDCGQITGVEQSMHQYFQGFGNKVNANIVQWLITGGDHPVVVDFSAGTPEMVRERFDRELIQSSDQHPRAQIEAAGVDPADVGTVVLTHLHLDHCAGIDLGLYPNAAILIQLSELRYAAAPYPPHYGIYDKGVMKRLLPIYASEYDNIRVIDGDLRLMDGVRVLHTPGHTPGTQAVLVDTDEGTYAIASDNVPFQSSWRGPTLSDWIPEGIHVSLKDCYDSLGRIAFLADHILPSHDYVVLEEASYPPNRAES
ncbi:MAG: N-acyl homoserine lactonase family protein [Actinobacteria bacterium]|nr:N-acyl homoserine lactonase family protein [Actinomycetota bacterium]